MKIRNFLKYYPKLGLAFLAYTKTQIIGNRSKDMESKTKNRKSRDQIAQMVEKAFGKPILAAGDDAISELKEGWFNAAYILRLTDGREVVLKIAPPKDAEVMTYEKNIMITEVESMQLVSENPSIPVPQIYFFDTDRDICDSYYFFMEKLVGENYDHVKKSLDKNIRVQIDQEIGGIIQEINNYTGTYFGYDGNSQLRAETWKEAFIKICDSVLNDAQRKNADLFFPIEEIRNVIHKHAPALDAVTIPKLVHWDAWDLNFFTKDGKVSGILDFERALWADPLMEAQFRYLDFEGVTDCMRGYGKTTFTFEEEQRNHLYTLHLALIMKTECYYRNYGTDEVSNLSKMLMIPAMVWLMEN
ncbi:MAG: aminoglycoside phosphotransferase family protein [Anaerolineaceae bacterium]|nr:aminoglycoside phosphotransferase family protein [Anaerolineaceae bacterium]